MPVRSFGVLGIVDLFQLRTAAFRLPDYRVSVNRELFTSRYTRKRIEGTHSLLLAVTAMARLRLAFDPLD